jgi:TolB-like protein/cytochrome c-type biogenesis protein CcmH/NrfG
LAVFEELRRRKVFQVAISYLIVAWLLTQVSDTLAPALRLPEWFHSGVVFLLILGFPVALFFAWAYELTPEGLRKDRGTDTAPARSPGRRLNLVIVALLAVAVAYIAFDKLALDRPVGESGSVPEDSRPAAVADRSIAVLPFVDMSPDKDQEYMSDGIAEEMLNLLAKVPELRVTSRSSAFAFKGRNVDIPTMAEQLGVAYVLEGSVRKAGERIRITAQLIEAGSDTHLWSETYDQTLDDVFAIQDEIATAVADALKITLLGAMPQARVIDGKAYDLALEARYFWNRRAPGDVGRALELYRQALELQPDYALAWTGVSVALAVQAQAGDIDREEGLERARAAAEKALELDPYLADAHVRMGQAHARAREPDESFRSYERALELEPDSVLALGVMGLTLRNRGRIEEAIPLLQRSVKLDPLGAIWPGNLATLLIQAGRYDEAENALARTRELNPAAVIEPELALIALLRCRNRARAGPDRPVARRRAAVIGHHRRAGTG